MRIAIVGGGPAGLFAAKAAARQGWHTILYERGKVGDDIVCGECIFDFFGILPKPQRGLLYDVEQVVIKVKSNYKKSVKEYGRMWMVDRREWQIGLKQQAEAYGAIIEENSIVDEARLRQIMLDFDWVIDASGAPSLSGKAFGFTDEYLQSFSVAYQHRMIGDFSNYKQSIYVRFLDNIPVENMPGYFWLFPRSDFEANVGIGYCIGFNGRTIDLKPKLAEVIAQEGLSDCEIVSSGGGFIPGKLVKKLVQDNIILIGDAAGTISKLHGEGIDVACISGALAIKALVEGRPQQYEHELRRILNDKNAMEQPIIELLKRYSFSDLDTFFRLFLVNRFWSLSKVTWSARRVWWWFWQWLRYKPHINPFC